MSKAIFGTKASPIISNSKDFIEYDWPEIQVISVEYPSQAGITILSYQPICCRSTDKTKSHPARRLSYFISKRGKDISGLSTDIINRTPNEENISDGIQTYVLVGGSSMGLEAICGIQEICLKDNIYWYNKLLSDKDREIYKYTPLHERVAGVCCYTSNLQDKSYVYPDMKLGKFAMKKLLSISRSPFKTQKIFLKQAGVGLNSTVAKLNDFDKDDDSWVSNKVKAGVGARFIEKDGLKVLVIINLNSVGVVHDKFKLLHEFPKGSKNKDITKFTKEFNKLKNEYLFGTNPNIPKSNTTISIICTNMILPHDKKEKLSEELHNEIESMIFPYGTLYDGDTLFVCSTWDIPFDEKLLKDTTKPLIRESIISVFNNNVKKGGGDVENNETFEYEKLYQKYKLKYLNLKNIKDKTIL